MYVCTYIVRFENKNVFFYNEKTIKDWVLAYQVLGSCDPMVSV
jgi:hypothetical protein